MIVQALPLLEKIDSGKNKTTQNERKDEEK